MQMSLVAVESILKNYSVVRSEITHEMHRLLIKLLDSIFSKCFVTYISNLKINE